jgi:hypothetical protein
MGVSLVTKVPINPFDKNIDPEAYQRHEDTYNPTFDWWFWELLLFMALSYGWQPLGTVLLDPDGEIVKDWCGSYFSNDHQVVAVEDATALANALVKAVDDIPFQEKLVPVDKFILEAWSGKLPDGLEIPDTSIYNLLFLPSWARQTIVDFITLCKNGSFIIC